MTTASAPTKLILLGEHTLLYGSRAVSIPMSQQTTVSISDNTSGGVRVISSLPLDSVTDRRLTHQVNYVMERLGAKPTNGIDTKINLNASPGVGMGVSASLAVAMVRAIAAHFKKPLSREQLLDLVEALEIMNHGSPSGIDHTTIIHNQPVILESKRGRQQLMPAPELSGNKITDSLYIMHTGTPQETTKEMIELVAKLYVRAPRKVQRLAKAIDALFPGLQSALKDGNNKELIKIINTAGRILEQLQVVSRPVMQLSNDIRRAGGAAKISGGGGRQQGSGMLIVFLQDYNKLTQLADQYKMQLMPINQVRSA